jgi:hypothetical protein
MTINESSLGTHAISTIETKFGNLYFFNEFLITEMFEGMIIGKKEFTKIFDLCLDIYGSNKPFGIVSHRIYPYSVNLSELVTMTNRFNSVLANAVVAYTDISLKNFELEKQLLGFKGKFFNNLDSSITWIKNEINQSS